MDLAAEHLELLDLRPDPNQIHHWASRAPHTRSAASCIGTEARSRQSEAAEWNEVGCQRTVVLMVQAFTTCHFDLQRSQARELSIG